MGVGLESGTGAAAATAAGCRCGRATHHWRESRRSLLKAWSLQNGLPKCTGTALGV